MEQMRSIAASTWRWLLVNPGSLPSIIALVAVAVFWTVGLVGGLSLLDEHQPPIATLIRLYLMLAMVAFSIIVAVLAASDLIRRVTDQKDRYRRIV